MLNSLKILYSLFTHYRVFGFEGILFLMKRVIFRNALIKIRIKGYPPPIFLRNNTSDITVFYQIFLEKSYNLNYSLEPKLIIDCGANIGLSSIFYYLKFPGARIIAVEPELSNFQLLTKNTRSIPNIVNINAGIWNKSASLGIVNSLKSKWEIQVKELSDTLKNSIQAISIPELMTKYNLTEIDILKVDIEGSEKELFDENYESWLPLTKVLIIELHDNLRKGAARSFFKAISKYNFRMTKKRENLIFYIE